MLKTSYDFSVDWLIGKVKERAEIELAFKLKG